MITDFKLKLIGDEGIFHVSYGSTDLLTCIFILLVYNLRFERLCICIKLNGSDKIESHEKLLCRLLKGYLYVILKGSDGIEIHENMMIILKCVVGFILSSCLAYVPLYLVK